MKQPEQHIINALLEKHALGICTPEERALLEQWYADFPEKGQVWQDASEKAAMKDTLKAGIFDVITPEKVFPMKRVWWQAAAVVVTLAITFLMYYKKDPEYVVASAAPGKGIIKIQLPDSSEMWLEPGTVVRYQKDFGTTNREIELKDGMAFFSVQEQAAHPFIVNLPGGVQAKVLGTGFTVKKYRQSEEVQIMVSTGAVQVSDSTGILGVLKTGQQLSYQQAAHTTTRTEGTPEDWRTGNLTISNASFAEVARILENRYGLHVTYNAANVATYRFTLRISKETTVAEVLEMLKDISGLEYTLANDKVTVH
jgi:ferric-dicitrate binding protein FerR (iron transport regulator)